MEAFTLLPDPQTNGGLLVSVREDFLEEAKKILGGELISTGRMVVAVEKTVCVK